MAWSGYFEFGGQEIINATRTETYAHAYGLYWLRAAYDNDAIGPMTGQTFTNPATDDAPWYDPDIPEAMEFMGAYPLSVGGIENSTITATVTESLSEGGVVGRPRRATRSITFSCALIASSERGAEYGARWLRDALTGNPCEDGLCAGQQLCYVASEPLLPEDADDPMACFDLILRSLYNVSPTLGPTIDGKYDLPSGGVAWIANWTMVAGVPFEFMVDRPLVVGFTDAASGFYVNPLYEVEDAFSVTATTHDETPCAEPVYRPLFDPACPVIIAPPPVPQIAVSCFSFPDEYDRRFFTIPKEEIPLYGRVVPVMTVKSEAEMRSLRVRFYSDVLDQGDPDLDSCSYCGDIVFSYIPPGSQITFDGVQRQVYADVPGQPRRRADALVFKSDGSPFEWPELTCGFSYLAVFDQPNTYPTPTVDLTLVSKVL